MSWPGVARSPILIRSCLLGLRVLAVVFADGGLGGQSIGGGAERKLFEPGTMGAGDYRNAVVSLAN